MVFAVGSYRGQIPDWVPNGDVVARPQPQPLSVEYPVFGSSDLVTYLASNMVAQREAIDVSYWLQNAGLSRDDVLDALSEVNAQNPYVFTSGWALDAAGTVTPVYTYDDDVADGKRILTAEAVAQGLTAANVEDAATDVERVKAIHDYIADTATYDYESYEAVKADPTAQNSPLADQSQEAYGILVAHTAVCNGYAKAFQLMAQGAGLQSVIVTGTAKGPTSGLHAWNEVLVDGQWLVVDVTWDDGDMNGQIRSDYLMVKTSDPVLASRSMDTKWVVDANIGMYGI